MRLLNKTALVTGASKGIGRAIAIGIAREAAHVNVNYNTDRRRVNSFAFRSSIGLKQL